MDTLIIGYNIQIFSLAALIVFCFLAWTVIYYSQGSRVRKKQPPALSAKAQRLVRKIHLRYLEEPVHVHRTFRRWLYQKDKRSS